MTNPQLYPHSPEEAALLDRKWGVCYHNGEALPVPPGQLGRPVRSRDPKRRRRNRYRHCDRVGRAVLAINLGLGEAS